MRSICSRAVLSAPDFTSSRTVETSFRWQARLADARFFWDEDRKAALESRIDRLGTILFHKALGHYKQKAERVSALVEEHRFTAWSDAPLVLLMHGTTLASASADHTSV